MSKLFGKRPKSSSTTTKTTTPTPTSTSSLSQPQTSTFTLSTLSPPWSRTFESLNLPQPLIKNLLKIGITKPTQIQINSIPPALAGSNILGISSTGSGKTLSFVLPILTSLSLDPYGIYALILSPTRELSRQIHEQVTLAGACYGVKSALITGGGDMVKQALELTGKPHFVVGTPGRIRSLMENDEGLNLRGVRFLVVDESDRVLSSRLANGLLKDCVYIADRCRGGRNMQVMAFSATGGRGVKEGLERISGGARFREVVVSGRGEEEKGKEGKKKKKKKKEEEEEEEGYSDDVDVSSGSDSSSSSPPSTSTPPPTATIPPGLKQEYIFMPHTMRDMYLVAALRHMMSDGGIRKETKEGEFEGSGWTLSKINGEGEEQDREKGARSAVVFVGTCERAAHIEGTFRELGIDCVALHSLLTQDRRNAALGKFKSQQVRVLIATDIASRGLDIPCVDLVINSELPRKARDYIHRVGRTARAGRRGRAVTLVGEEDVGLVHAAEKLAGREMVLNGDIKDKDVVKLMSSVAKASRITKVKLDEVGFGKLVKKRKGRKEKERKARNKVLKNAGVR